MPDAYQRLAKTLSGHYRLERELGSGGMATRGRPTVAGCTISRWTSGVVSSVNGVSVAGGPPHVFVRFDDPTRPSHRFGFGVHAQTAYVTLGDLESDIWVADITSRR